MQAEEEEAEGQRIYGQLSEAVQHLSQAPHGLAVGDASSRAA